MWTLYLHLFPNHLYLVLSPNTGHQAGPEYITLISITLCRDNKNIFIRNADCKLNLFLVLESFEIFVYAENFCFVRFRYSFKAL